MSEQHDAHDTPIKTPKQLIIVILAAFIIPIITIVLLVQYVAHHEQTGAGSKAMTPEAVAERIKPVASVDIKDPNAAVVLKSGEEVFKAVCTACHTPGAAGAPKLGDKAAWAPRLSKGLDALLQSALNGKNAMSPQRGVAEDLEIARAIVYMANNSGGNLKEPAVKGQAATK